MAGEPIPRRTFVVTFDDGYESVYETAWPILKELSIPATVFIVTSYLDSGRPFVFDDWAAAGSAAAPAAAWRPLSTAQCNEMARDGLIELGSHTHTHADFRGRPEEFRRDLAGRWKYWPTRLTYNRRRSPFRSAASTTIWSPRRERPTCLRTRRGTETRGAELRSVHGGADLR